MAMMDIYKEKGTHESIFQALLNEIFTSFFFLILMIFLMKIEIENLPYYYAMLLCHRI